MTKLYVSVVFLVSLLVTLFPLSSSAAHYLGHGAQPSAKQINEFCTKTYPEQIKSPNTTPQRINQLKQAHKKYCQKKPKPTPEPEAVKGQIDRLLVPTCIARGATLRVRGDALISKGLTCDLNRKSLKPSSRTETQFVYRLDKILDKVPGPTYNFRCEIEGKDQDKVLKACADTGIPEAEVEPEASPGEVDLTVEAIEGEVLVPQKLQIIDVTILSRGQSQTQAQRYQVMLVLADEDLSGRSRRLPSRHVLAQRVQPVPGSLVSGQSVNVPVPINIPAKLPDKSLYWCAYVGTDQQVRGLKKTDNFDCVPVFDEQTIARKEIVGAGALLQGIFGRKVKKVSTNKELNLRQSPGLSSRILPIIRDPGRPPLPATASCVPVVYMWFEPGSYRNVYYADQALTVRYSVDCATSVSIGDTEFFSTAVALAASRGGWFTDHGAGGTFHADAAAAGVLNGSRTYGAGSTAGNYRWQVSASNRLNPSAGGASENAEWQVIANPRIDTSCAEYVSCITSMVRHIAPLIDAGIINNDALDREVEAFSAGVYNRRTIGLQLKRELETMDVGSNVLCSICTDESHYSESTPENIWLYMCESPREYATDYAVLHELTHKNGFDSRLIRALMDRGVWPRVDRSSEEYRGYRSRVEEMTAAVSGAPFDRSRICFDYSE